MATGRGHLTDKAIIDALALKKVEIIWKPDELLPLHPNGMMFEALDGAGNNISSWKVYSVGGGAIKDEENFNSKSGSVYPLSNMTKILKYVYDNGLSLWEFVEKYEGTDIWDYLAKIWESMKQTIKKGLEHEGALPGGLGVQRKASSYYIKAKQGGEHIKRVNLIFAYALATSEENASGGTVVTAPTCGSSGVLPSVLYFMREMNNYSERKILEALATAGLVGNIAKTNASISGAEVGCQGEVGVACSMAAAAVSQLMGISPAQIEYAAETAMEHNLGLTCDPVGGLVQIPCIERNAFVSSRAIECAVYVLFSDGKHKVSYDKVLEVMLQTGHSLNKIYRETALGGLAKVMENKIKPIV